MDLGIWSFVYFLYDGQIGEEEWCSVVGWPGKPLGCYGRGRWDFEKCVFWRGEGREGMGWERDVREKDGKGANGCIVVGGYGKSSFVVVVSGLSNY